MSKKEEKLKLFEPRLKIYIPHKNNLLQYYYDIGIRLEDDTLKILAETITVFRANGIKLIKHNCPRFLENFIENDYGPVKVQNLGCYHKYKNQIQKIKDVEIIEEKLTDAVIKRIRRVYNKLMKVELIQLRDKYNDIIKELDKQIEELDKKINQKNLKKRQIDLINDFGKIRYELNNVLWKKISGRQKRSLSFIPDNEKLVGRYDVDDNGNFVMLPAVTKLKKQDKEQEEDWKW